MVKEVKEVKEVKAAKIVKEITEAKEVKEATEVKEVKEAEVVKAVKEVKEAKEFKEVKEVKQLDDETLEKRAAELTVRQRRDSERFSYSIRNPTGPMAVKFETLCGDVLGMERYFPFFQISYSFCESMRVLTQTNTRTGSLNR